MRVAIAVVMLGACQPRIVDLGRDAAVDTGTDANMCRCRIMPCRVPGDCTLIGGACGADFYCVGDFGTCASDIQCQATFTRSVCTLSTTSTAACR